MNKKSDSLLIVLGGIKDEFITEAYVEMAYSKKAFKKREQWVIGLCLVMLLLIILPNSSPAFAKTLGDLPYVGRFFQVVTIQRVEIKNGRSEIEVDYPKVIGETNSQLVNALNNDIHDYITESINSFQEDHGEDRAALNIGYKIVSENEAWLSLLVYTTEIQASGYELRRYYNIDKVTGKSVAFNALFDNYGQASEKINAYIKAQMQKQMEEDDDLTYFIYPDHEDGFQSVSDSQNYYLDEAGQLVVSFDEYEVAPGYMGVVEFVISEDVYE